MKKIGSIMMMLILLMQSGGLLLLYKIEQYNVQNEMEAGLNDKKTLLQKITLSLKDFQKGMINSHEIFVKGKMYDFRSVSITGCKVELLAINDTKEEGIIENFNRALNTGSQQNEKLPVHFFKLLTLLYILRHPCQNFLLQPKQSIYYSLPGIIISYKSFISSPPPKWSDISLL